MTPDPPSIAARRWGALLGVALLTAPSVSSARPAPLVGTFEVCEACITTDREPASLNCESPFLEGADLYVCVRTGGGAGVFVPRWRSAAGRVLTSAASETIAPGTLAGYRTRVRESRLESGRWVLSITGGPDESTRARPIINVDPRPELREEAALWLEPAAPLEGASPIVACPGADVTLRPACDRPAIMRWPLERRDGDTWRVGAPPCGDEACAPLAPAAGWRLVGAAEVTARAPWSPSTVRPLTARIAVDHGKDEGGGTGERHVTDSARDAIARAAADYRLLEVAWRLTRTAAGAEPLARLPTAAGDVPVGVGGWWPIGTATYVQGDVTVPLGRIYSRMVSPAAGDRGARWGTGRWSLLRLRADALVEARRTAPTPGRVEVALFPLDGPGRPHLLTLIGEPAR